MLVCVPPAGATSAVAVLVVVVFVVVALVVVSLGVVSLVGASGEAVAVVVEAESSAVRAALIVGSACAGART